MLPKGSDEKMTSFDLNWPHGHDAGIAHLKEKDSCDNENMRANKLTILETPTCLSQELRHSSQMLRSIVSATQLGSNTTNV